MYATKEAPLKNYFLRLDYKKSKLEVKENEYLKKFSGAYIESIPQRFYQLKIFHYTRPRIIIKNRKQKSQLETLVLL